MNQADHKVSEKEVRSWWRHTERVRRVRSEVNGEAGNS
jgi:hypothetical protein